MPKNRTGFMDAEYRKKRLEHSIQGRARRAVETLWKHGCIAERGDPTAYQIVYDALREQCSISKRSTKKSDAARKRRTRSRAELLEEERRRRLEPVPLNFDPFKEQRRHRVSRTLL